MAYKNRYSDKCMQNAYENAYDCHYCGEGNKYWSDCGIPKENRAEVWKVAFYDCAEPDYHPNLVQEVRAGLL